MGAPEEADADEAEAPPTSDAPLESLLRRPSVAPTTGDVSKMLLRRDARSTARGVHILCAVLMMTTLTLTSWCPR